MAKELKANGYVVVPGGKHLAVVRVSDGKRVGTLPSSPSDYRSVKNARSQFRASGVLV